MSDIKRECPACQAWTSSVGIAFRDGEPCPYCGLPAQAVEMFDRAREAGVKREVTQRLIEVESAAARLKRENGSLCAALSSIRQALAHVDANESADSDEAWRP